FTVFGCFNKGISNENRIALMKGIGSKLGVTAKVPTEFDGIPVLNNMRAWFFSSKDKRKKDDIPNLWNLFEAAINYADNPSEITKAGFIACYDKVRHQFGIKWNLTMGLYWIRPFSYLNLDEPNRNYLMQDSSPYYSLISKISNLKQLPSAKTYLELISVCKKIFTKDDSLHPTFPALSFTAWNTTTSKEENKNHISTGKGTFGWIFQGNPKYYDVIGAVKELDVITWSVRQYQKQIKKGDRAYIWISGPEGGIVASGIIISNPEIRENDELDPYDLTGNINTGENPVVDIELKHKITDAVIKREDFLADERLKNVNIITFPNATNYKLTPEQADVIDSIINGTYIRVEPKLSNETSALSRRYWIYAPGRASSKWEEFYSQGIMGIGWDEMGDLKQYPSKDAMKTKMKKLYGAEYSYINSALATWQFANEIQAGDVVYAKKGMYKIIGRGIVESDYIFDAGRKEYKHIRKIKWTHNGEWEHPGQAVMKTLTDITPYTEYLQKLEALFIDDEAADIHSEEPEIKYDPYTEDDFLSEVFMDAENYNTLVNLLRTKKNIILQGAPGVGKTFTAKRLAFSMMGQKDTSRLMMVQFHQSYSYEDFIMGFRPSKDGFELTPGPFYQFCKKAQDDDERDYFFIIDEINRGNVSKIFGELMMLIEKDKRGEKLRLLYSNELFSVPNNVYIIGMMNTADRSLAIIDYALRRRFAFFELEPAFDSAGFKRVMQQANNPKFNTLVEQIKALNDFISKDESLGSGFRIGHSYLCTNSEVTDEWLEAIIKYELLPLLNEYWFDEPSKIEQWSKKLCGALDD
ncbi:MAG TPA: EVE domain-containing protein, partial [Clostridia bacterium]|nr:EVE domain-containing protein [Clostridia bacterium]